jgi:pilus assembly protein CpaC
VISKYAIRKIFALGVMALLSGSAAAHAAVTNGPVPAAMEAGARIVHVATSNGAPVNQRMTLPLDKAAIIELDTEAHDVLVSNPDIVDAVVRSPKRIFLLATKAGQTNAFFFDANGKQILSLDIRVEKDVTDLGTLMKTSLPNSAVTVQAMNDNIILTGKVASAQEATRAADLAASFTGDPKKVVNMLQVAGGEQVMLKVRMAEMDRNIAKQFGVNLAGIATISNAPVFAESTNPYGLTGAALSDLTGVQAGNVCGVGGLSTAAGCGQGAEGVL